MKGFTITIRTTSAYSLLSHEILWQVHRPQWNGNGLDGLEKRWLARNFISSNNNDLAVLTLCFALLILLFSSETADGSPVRIVNIVKPPCRRCYVYYNRRCNFDPFQCSYADASPNSPYRLT
ncbi:hypothetical protein E2C01_014031 [Portunus trituberculatus]|uniref:Uncharacterized protein n=1 Tax=Portunus trituberculatus TaxID=210409 RepID=A0A5B7DI32_PORTR|nr:hypothetical protein [Portunus trituberculatus]